MNIRTILVEKAIAAMTAAGLPEDTNPAVTQSTRPQFGDYQINGAMGAAKKMKSNPRELAQKIIDQLDVSDIAEKTEIAMTKPNRVKKLMDMFCINLITTEIKHEQLKNYT